MPGRESLATENAMNGHWSKIGYLRKRAAFMLTLGLLLPLACNAQWSKGAAGVLRYHCAGCTGIPDLTVSRSTISMPDIVWGDITLRDSIGQTVAELKGVRFNASADTARVGGLYRFITRRNGYVQLLLYQPMEWSPGQYESFTYEIPTVRRAREERVRY